MGLISDSLKVAIEGIAWFSGSTVEYSTEAVPSTWTSITGYFHDKGSSIEYSETDMSGQQIQEATLTTSTSETALSHGNWIRVGGASGEVWSIRGKPGGQDQRIYNLVRAPRIRTGPDRGDFDE